MTCEATLLENILAALYQYRDDLKRPPVGDSLERRNGQIDKLAKAITDKIAGQRASQHSELAGDWTPFNYKNDKIPDDRLGGWLVTWESGLVETIASFDDANYAHIVKYKPALRRSPDASSDGMRPDVDTAIACIRQHLEGHRKVVPELEAAIAARAKEPNNAR